MILRALWVLRFEVCSSQGPCRLYVDPCRSKAQIPLDLQLPDPRKLLSDMFSGRGSACGTMNFRSISPQVHKSVVPKRLPKLLHSKAPVFCNPDLRKARSQYLPLTCPALLLRKIVLNIAVGGYGGAPCFWGGDACQAAASS